MKNQVSIADIEQYVDGQLGEAGQHRIQAAVQQDAELARVVRDLDRINAAVVSRGRRISAPAALRERLHDRYGIQADGADADLTARSGRRIRQAGQPARRLLLGGGAAAAAVATVFAIPSLRSAWQANPPVAQTFFRDFETYLVKDQAVDIVETDLSRIAQWYSTRLPFALPPISSAGAGASLVGGRLCWLLERRLASLSYRSADGPIVLYIAQASGIALPAGQSDADFGDYVSWHRAAGNASVIWVANGLLMAMVGRQELRKLMSVARSIAG